MIVIDDGSKDEPRRCGAIPNKNTLAGRCIKQENKKIAGAPRWNSRGARRYIAFLDHDDAWFPENSMCHERVLEHPRRI